MTFKLMYVALPSDCTHSSFEMKLARELQDGALEKDPELMLFLNNVLHHFSK